MQRSRLVARNVAATLITQLLSWGMTIVVMFYLPAYLGASGLGELTLVGSYAGIFAVFVGLGVSTVLIREIARDHERTAELVTAAIMLRIPLAVVTVLIGIAVSKGLHYSAGRQLLILLSLVLMSLMQVSDVLAAALRGLEEIPRQNAAALVDKFVSSALQVYLVIHHAPLSWIVAVGFVSTTISLTINATAFRPYYKRFVWPTWDSCKMLAISGLPFFTTYAFVAIYGQSDSLLLDKLSSTAAVGWYGLAKRWGGATLFIPVALANALLPTLSRIHAEDKESFDRNVRRLIGYMFLLVVPFASILILAPGPLLRLMHCGPSFIPAIPVLIALGFAIILWYLSQAAGTALIACDGQRVLSRTTGFAALISVPVCAALIWATQRWFANGAVGAVVSDTVVEMFMVGMYLRALPSGCVSGRQMGVLAKAVLAALPMILPLYFVHGSRWSLLVVAPGLIAYGPICYALGCLTRDDIQLFKGALGRKVGAVSADNISHDSGYAEGASLEEEEKTDAEDASAITLGKPAPNLAAMGAQVK